MVLPDPAALTPSAKLELMKKLLKKHETSFALLLADGLMFAHLADASKNKWKAIVAATKEPVVEYFDVPDDEDERNNLLQKIDAVQRLQEKISWARVATGVAESFVHVRP